MLLFFDVYYSSADYIKDANLVQKKSRKLLHFFGKYGILKK